MDTLEPPKKNYFGFSIEPVTTKLPPRKQAPLILPSTLDFVKRHLHFASRRISTDQSVDSPKPTFSLPAAAHVDEYYTAIPFLREYLRTHDHGTQYISLFRTISFRCPQKESRCCTHWNIGVVVSKSKYHINLQGALFNALQESGSSLPLQVLIGEYNYISNVPDTSVYEKVPPGASI